MTAVTTTRPERKFTPHLYYSMTKSLCGVCKRSVDAKILFRDGKVWFDKFCPEHGHQECAVASSVEWYLDALSFVAPNTPPQRHQQAGVGAGLPASTAAPCRRTSRRSTCRSCRSRRRATSIARSATRSTRTTTRTACRRDEHRDDPRPPRRGPRRARHHQLHRRRADAAPAAARASCRCAATPASAASRSRPTASSCSDEAYVRKLAALDARIVLSLDTFRPETDKMLLGANTVKAKLTALDLLEKYDVATTHPAGGRGRG